MGLEPYKRIALKRNGEEEENPLITANRKQTVTRQSAFKIIVSVPVHG